MKAGLPVRQVIPADNHAALALAVAQPECGSHAADRSFSSKASVAAAPHARSLAASRMQASAGRPSVVGSVPRLRPTRRGGACTRPSGVCSRFWRATRAENPARRAVQTRPMLAVFRACPGKAFSDVSGLYSHAPVTATHHRTVARDTPRAHRPPSVYAFSDHSPIVATFED
jgi:hypothetical protein